MHRMWYWLASVSGGLIGFDYLSGEVYAPGFSMVPLEDGGYAVRVMGIRIMLTGGTNSNG